MDARERLACPSCGSEFFLSTKTSEVRVAFHVSVERTPMSVEACAVFEDSGKINLENFHCGACSWRGAVGSLVESRM
jgi:C4-type Zn-finger protein